MHTSTIDFIIMTNLNTQLFLVRKREPCLTCSSRKVRGISLKLTSGRMTSTQNIMAAHNKDSLQWIKEITTLYCWFEFVERVKLVFCR